MEIHVERRGFAGILTLDRPRARNALTLDMVLTLDSGLRGFAEDPAVRRIVMRSDVLDVFCAGGDIRRIRELVLLGSPDEAMRFLAEEFALNLAISRSRKPFIALIDGICFGGGCGISVHGSHRIVTEKALLAMPETRIGYFPDVGSSYFLSRLPFGLGTYVGLAGARVGPGDAVALGLATAFVPGDRLADLLSALANDSSEADAVIDRFRAPVEPGPIWARRQALAGIFSGSGLPDILRSLAGTGEPWSEEILEDLRQMSPASLATTVELLRSGAGSPLEECLAREFATAREVIQSDDYIEGVRALLVDKDNRPRWRGSLERLLGNSVASQEGSGA